MPANCERAAAPAMGRCALGRASGQPAVSVGCKRGRTPSGLSGRAQLENARGGWRQRGGGHGGRQPLRSVLQRTRRIRPRGKWTAELRRDARSARRGRPARSSRRRLRAGAAGGACGADLGSSSTSTSVQRRVRPAKEVTRPERERRGHSPGGCLGGNADTTAADAGDRFPAQGLWSVALRARRAAR